MLKLYPNEPITSVREGDEVTDKGFGRTFIAESGAIFVRETDSYTVKGNGKWLEVSPKVDILCEEVKEDEYA